MALKKSLGQHWLRDRQILQNIAAQADIKSTDMVLEIGPGLGTLTSALLVKAKSVIAVEFDTELASKLPAQFPGKNLEIVTGDILSFDLSNLPKNYKVVANLPYYITSKIIQTLLTSSNPPSLSVLLVQKEVALRLAASPGKMSLLALSAQIFCEVDLGQVVQAKFFDPPPKVDSQVIILRRRPKPLVEPGRQKDFFQVAKAGFSQKRKKLRSSLAASFKVEKWHVESWLQTANIAADARAEALSAKNWQDLAAIIKR